MWKASVVVSAVEVITYAVIAMVAMVRAGSGSGVWLAMLPIFWAILALRLWIVLRAADALADVGSWQFVAIVAMFGFLLSMAFLVVFWGRVDSWKEFSGIVFPTLAHFGSAALACRWILSNHGVQVGELRD